MLTPGVCPFCEFAARYERGEGEGGMRGESKAIFVRGSCIIGTGTAGAGEKIPLFHLPRFLPDAQALYPSFDHPNEIL